MPSNEQQSKWYWEVIIECLQKNFDLLSSYLFDIGATGILEISELGEIKTIKVYFSSQLKSPEKTVQDLKNRLGRTADHLEVVSIERKPYQDWKTEWKIHFKPICIGSNFLVRPPWEKLHPDKQEIVIDPGQGFGTGYHLSTAIALQLLEWVRTQSEFGKVLDVGAGSGILTIGALLLGASQVTAIDTDENVRDEISKNLRLSNIHPAKCQVFIQGPKSLNADFDLVMANIENQILLEMINDLERLTKHMGFLILSGILFEYRQSFKMKLPKSMKIIKELQIEEWWGIILRKG